MKEKDHNFLDYVPLQSEKYRFETSDDGVVTFFVENKGFFNFIAQKIFNKPRISQIHLEEFGSFIWPLIDGKKSVKEIADLVHQHFGEKSEPLYPRISMYFNLLERYDFVSWKKDSK